METEIRRFVLIRTTDVTGISGTGHIAVGVQWPNETCTLFWLKYQTQGMYASMKQLQEIHCYNENASIEWVDKDVT